MKVPVFNFWMHKMSCEAGVRICTQHIFEYNVRPEGGYRGDKASLFGSCDGHGNHIVLQFALLEDFDPRTFPNQAASCLLRRFSQNGREADGTATRDRLKLTPLVANVDEWAMKGPLTLAEHRLLSNYKGKPTMTRPQHHFFKGQNYMEVDLDIHVYMYLARKAILSYMDRCSNLVTYKKDHRLEGDNFSTSDLSSTRSVTANSYTITEHSLCDKPAHTGVFSLEMHIAVMDYLDSDMLYGYNLGGLYSGRFRSPPITAADSTFDFIAFADMGEDLARRKKNRGSGLTARAIAAEVEDGRAALVLHVGDISYADGLSTIWNSFMDQIQPIAESVPYMVAIGNHEYDYSGKAKHDPSGVDSPYHPDWGDFATDRGGECGAMTYYRFPMPSRGLAARAPVRLPGGTVRPARHRKAKLLEASATASHPTRSTDAAQSSMSSEDLEASVAHVRSHHRKPSQSVESKDTDLIDRAADSSDRTADSSDRTDTESLPSIRVGDAGQSPASNGTDYGDSTAGFEPLSQRSSLADNPPFGYSCEYGKAHFAIVSTVHDINPGTEQHERLSAGLAGVDRCVTPWLIVAFHRPMYVAYPHKMNRVIGEHLREAFEDLLLEYEVERTIPGHEHSYVRSCALDGRSCTANGDGVVHFVVGTGGKELSGAAEDQAEWCLGHFAELGYTRFSVGQDSLHVDFLASKDGKVRDHIRLEPCLACSTDIDGRAVVI